MEIKKVKLKNEIASFYQHLFTYYPKKRHIILQSGRACTKSTFFAILYLWKLLLTPHGDVLVLAYEYSSIKDKVFLDYKFAASRLRIPDSHIKFHSTENGRTWIKVRNKWGWNVVHFEHAKGGAEALKGKRPTPGNEWIGLHFYELTNFLNWTGSEVSNTVATMIRNAKLEFYWDKIKVKAESLNEKVPVDKEEVMDKEWFMEDCWSYCKSVFCITYEFNTPGFGLSGGAWVNEWLHTKKNSPDVWYQLNTYLDMTKQEAFRFLKPELLEEINNVKETDPITYNHIYLAKEPYDGDMVYPSLNRATHFGEHENFDPDWLIIGVDVGRSDATVLTLNGFEFANKDLRVQLAMHRWSHCNRKMSFFKDGVRLPYKPYEINEYSNMILEFIQMVHDEYPHKYIYFQMDYANEGKAFYDITFPNRTKPLYLYLERDWNKILPSKRIDGMNALISVPGILKIKDPMTFQAFQNQVYDKSFDKDGERKRLDDFRKPTLDMDSIDSCEYGFRYSQWDSILQWIRKTKGKRR